MPIYKLKRLLFSMSDSFSIKNQDGNVVFVVKQTFLKSVMGARFSKVMKKKAVLLPGIDGAGFTKLVFYDPTELYDRIVVRQRFNTVKPYFDIERDGNVIATLREQLTWPRCWCCYEKSRKFIISFVDGTTLPIYVRGTLMDMVLIRNDKEIGTVSRSYFSVSDNYGLETRPGEDDEFLLAITISVGTILKSN